MFRKLFVANLKMYVRNKQALFWSLAFPLIFTVIFGLFFGRDSSMSGTIAVVNQSKSDLAVNLEKALTDSKLFNISDEKNIETAKDMVSKSKISALLVVPETFGAMNSAGTFDVNVYYDPASTQAPQVLSGFLNNYLTQASFQIQHSKSLFTVNMQRTGSGKTFTYFDFVLAGILGLSLMNSSVIGVASAMATYREEKILKRITTTPLRPWIFMAAEIASRTVTNLIQVGVILTIGVYGFHGHIYGNVFILLGVVLFAALFFQLFGFAIAAFAKTSDAAVNMTQAITVPMMFLGGTFFPIDTLPKWLFNIVQFLPLAPLLRIIRQVAIDAVSPFSNVTNVYIVVGWVLLISAVSIWRFRLSDE